MSKKTPHFKIYIGSDHAGFKIKEKIIPWLKNMGYEVCDYGAFQYDEYDDYPDFIAPVAKAVSLNPDHVKGIILGGSGQGEAIVANRFPHVRAIVYYGRSISSFKNILKLGREHNNSNIISIGARFVGLSSAKSAILKWLETPFSWSDRHIRRIKKIEKVTRDVRNMIS
ncbi:MAG: RpiB/LacA/LacB family sugar-phosphate isomerase [Minisyncoccia bacterium]